MPKNFIILLLLPLLLVAGAAAQSPKLRGKNRADIERYIRDCEAAWAASVATGDTAVLEQMLADDYVGVDPKGKVYNKTQMVADTKTAPKYFRSNKIDYVNIRFFGDNTAVAQGSESWERHDSRRGQFVWMDTWIKRNGKWQIVAAEDLIPPATEAQPPAGDGTDVAKLLISLENEWAQVDVTNDRSIFQRILAPDFVSTSISGRYRANRKEYLDAWEYENVKSAANSEMKVHIHADNVAVVTGIDTTRGTDASGQPWEHQDRFTDTWVKRDGQWRCVAAQVFRIR